MPSDGLAPHVYELRRSEYEIGQLQNMCSSWGSAFWQFDDILRAIERPGSLVLFSAQGQEAPWQGVILIDVGPFAADLLYIYARPEARRSGVARRLLSSSVYALQQRPQVEDFFLEVRASNDAAQQLYLSEGWEQIGRRAAYYSNREDALVFRYRLRGTDGSAGRKEEQPD